MYRKDGENIDVSSSDTVISRYSLINEHGKNISPFQPEPHFPEQTLTSENALRQLLERRFENYVWRILSRTSIYRDNGFTFPEGKAFEDRYTIYKILYYSQSIAFLPHRLYHYRMRTGSIVHHVQKKSMLDSLQAFQERSAFIDQHIPELHEACLGNDYSTYTGIYRKLLMSKEQSKTVQEIQEYIYTHVHIRQVLTLPGLPLEKRIQLLLITTRLMIPLLLLINMTRRLTSHSY